MVSANRTLAGRLAALVKGQRVAEFALLAGFVVAVVGFGAFIGASMPTDGWYQALVKPAFNPPNWVFAVVWPTLYVLIAASGWLVAVRAPDSVAMQLWTVQLILNWMWSPAFFWFHLTWLAFAIILALLIAIGALVLLSWRINRAASLMFFPYAAWVAFSAYLNLGVALLN